MFGTACLTAFRASCHEWERLSARNHAPACNAGAEVSVFDSMESSNHARRGRYGPAVVAIALVVFASLASPPSPAQDLPPVMEDIREPEQLSRDLEQSSGEIVLLHFWASWCLPCREEMTSLADFWRQEYPELAERGLRVVTISNDVRDKDLERFASEFDLAFPLYYDPYSRLRSKRSRVMTLVHASTKSLTNFSLPSFAA